MNSPSLFAFRFAGDFSADTLYAVSTDTEQPDQLPYRYHRDAKECALGVGWPAGKVPNEVSREFDQDSGQTGPISGAARWKVVFCTYRATYIKA